MNTRARIFSCTLSLLAASALPACGAADNSAPEETGAQVSSELSDSDGGAVYAMTNDRTNNAVVHYARRAGGRLVRISSTDTGGKGTGTKQVPNFTADSVDPLESAHALAVDEHHHFLYAANAGDGSVSVFEIDRHGELELLSRRTTGGHTPNSIATHGNSVYVSHAGNASAGIPSTVMAFKVDHHGGLSPLGAPRQLGVPSASQGVDVVVSADGRRVIVADLPVNQIAVFPVRFDGSLGDPTFNPSAGANPFGMAVTSNGIIISTEAEGIVTGASTVSSYRLEGTRLVAISSAVPNGQTAACWASVTPDGRFAFSSNTAVFGGSGTISIYAVSPNGRLTLVDGAGAQRTPPPGTLTSGPVDSFMSPDGRFLYQQWGGLGVVGAYSIGEGGALTPVPGGDGLGLPPISTEGLAGY